MSAPERATETRRWLRYAREDLAAAEALHRGGGAPRTTCFHTQQSAEKAIKAVLVFLDIAVPRIHDLDALRNMVPEGWGFKDEFPRLGSLTYWLTAGRYPGAWPEPTADDAAQAISQASAVLAAITRDLASHGLATADS